jgi:hypothetical protein
MSDRILLDGTMESAHKVVERLYDMIEALQRDAAMQFNDIQKAKREQSGPSNEIRRRLRALEEAQIEKFRLYPGDQRTVAERLGALESSYAEWRTLRMVAATEIKKFVCGGCDNALDQIPEIDSKRGVVLRYFCRKCGYSITEA